MMPPLSRAHFRHTIRELDEVAVATSVTGTSKAKTRDLADLAQRMHDALVGDRPEIAKVRKELRLKIHNLRRSPINQRAAKRMRDLLSVVRDLQKLVDQKGWGAVPEVFVIEGFEVLNSWGYTERELKALFVMLRRATRMLGDVGLKVGTVPVLADPEAMKQVRGAAASEYMAYVEQDDLFVANPSSKLSGDMESVLRAIAARIWSQQMDRDHRQTWDRAGGANGFADAFARKLASDQADSDTAARLLVTVGQIARRWAA